MWTPILYILWSSHGGDIFEGYKGLFDFILTTCMQSEDVNFFRKIFENIKANEEIFFAIKQEPKFEILKYKQYINMQLLRLTQEEDLRIIIRMLNRTLRGAIASTFKNNHVEQSRREFYQALDYLKYGILKERVEK